MSIANPEAVTLTLRQRVFIGVLGVLSVVLAALVVFYSTTAAETSKALPGQHLSPTVHGDRSVVIQESVGKFDQRHGSQLWDPSLCHEAENLHGIGQGDRKIAGLAEHLWGDFRIEVARKLWFVLSAREKPAHTAVAFLCG
jgi:hypothetical protein